MSTRKFMLFLLLMLSACLVWAQGTGDATVSGTVSDPSGAHIVNATVTALSAATGALVTVSTNEAGVYVFPALPPGTYRISAEHAGFRKSTLTDVVLQVASQISVNIQMELGQTTETVEVQSVVTDVNASTATVGTVIEARKILDLPLVGRSAYDLINTQPGVVTNGTTSVNINGNQTGSINYTTDGINTQDNLLNGAFNTNVSNTVSIDRVEEFRIVSSPADAEYGRGGTQVQLVTRGGSNAFHGSAWEELRNTDLNANDWFNNQAGRNALTGAMNAPRNVLVRNQFGLRMGGPVKKNKMFFNGIWEEDHQNQRVAANETVLTPSAIAGNFSFFPGAQNENITGVTPTVSSNGTPIQPATATGPLQTISVFGRDPNRLTADPTGSVQRILALEPLPNNYLVGDGINTAGFLWSRPVIDDFQLYEGRIDEIFNEKHRLSITLNHQAYTSINVANAQPLPTSPVGLAPTETTQYSAHFTSSLSANLLNEATFGVFRPRVIVYSDYDPLAGPSGVAGEKLLPVSNGTSYYLNFAGAEANPLSPASSSTGTSSNRISQNWEYADALTWIHGKHTFKGGATVRFINNAGYDEVGTVPQANAGAASSVPVAGLNTVPGIGLNLTAAQNQLIDLSGSLASATQVLNAPGGTNPQYIPGETRYSNLVSKEISGFFKDDWKITPSLTLNLGVRWEYYGVPNDADGRLQALVCVGAGIFGISGTTLGSLFNPGASGGSLTQVQLIGDGTAHPNTQLYNSDYHNFGPAVGFAWSLPEGARWLTGGKDKTVIRAGYGISYERNALYVDHMYNSYEPDGLATTVTEQQTAALNLTNVQFPIPNNLTPLFTEPLNGLRAQSVYSFQNNLENPMIHNFNFSIQRALTNSTSLTVSYIGNIGRDLLRAYDVNEVNILAPSPDGETFLQAFNTVRNGGDSPFIDQLLKPVFGALPASIGLRSVSLFQGILANNNPAELAGLINGSSLSGNVGGALLAAAGLPANFFVVNPQFGTFPLGSSAVLPGGAYTVDNSGHSNYNSLQVQVQRRLQKGLTVQGSYVFSKVTGDSTAGESAIYLADYRTLRNRSLDNGVLGFNHTSVLKINGIYEFPFGPGKQFLSSSNGVLSRIVGGWQLGAIFTTFTGAPLTLTGANGLNMSFAEGVFLGTANQTGALPQGVTRVGNGVEFFPGATQVTDPQVGTIAAALQSLSTLKAIQVNGNTVLTNATPGNLGYLGNNTLAGPGGIRLDTNVAKRIRINEKFYMEIRATAENLTNTETFAAPNTNIDSTSFGKITGTAAGFTPRILVFQARLTF
jgi:hypothetical protein